MATTLALTGAYALYAALLVPLLKAESLPGPSGPRQTAQPIVVPPLESRRMAERYLASQPWTTDAKYQLRTAEAFVYFEEWDRVDADRGIRFRPFAVVWLQKDGEKDDPPITIVCDSAYLKFASKFEITNNPGRVVEAALEKEVRITGPDGLSIEGRNFVFSESAMRIWSDNPVRFAYGEHRGDGHGPQIDLVPEKKVEPSDSLAVSGIRTVRLRRDVRMHLVGRRDSPQGEPSELDPPPASTESGPDGEHEPITVHVTSEGPFEFQVESHQATFEKQVRVVRPTNPAVPDETDSLDCERLTLVFQPEKEASGRRKPGGDKDDPEAGGGVAGRFANVESRLTFQRLLAEGEQVLLVSHANRMEATMTELVYDAESRVAALSDGQGVRVLREGSELFSPEITITHDEAGELASTSCRGAGRLRQRNVLTGAVELAAQWEKELRVHPEAESGLQIIELKEHAIVQQPAERMGIAADFIRLWVEPAEGSGSAQAQQSFAPSRAVAGNGTGFRLRRALAMGDVAVAGPQLEAQTKRLEVWFEAAAASRPSPPAAGREPRDRLKPALERVSYVRRIDGESSTTPAAPLGESGASSPRLSLEGSGTRRPSPDGYRRAPTEGWSGGPLGGRGVRAASPETPPQSPVQVVADLIRLRVVEEPDASQQAGSAGRDDYGPPSRGRDEPRSAPPMRVAEIWTEGSVEVHQQHEAGEESLHLVGDRLHLLSPAENSELVHLSGRPAHVRDRGLHVEGPEIHLDRAANRMWVEGSGLLELPVDQTPDGQPLPTPEPLDVWWKERMDFDGLTALFRGEVRTVLRDNRMRCEEMEVHLTERLDFTAAGSESRGPNSETGNSPPGTRNSGPGTSNRPNARVKQVICRDGVQVESHEYEGSKLVGVRQARFWELTVDQATGDSLARGPGWILAWSRGNGRRAALAPAATAQANRPASSETAGWEYMRIDFAGRTAGNLHQRHTTFQDQVQIVYGPVEKPLEIIDVDRLPKDGGWLRCDRLRFTQHEATPQQPAYVELLADGNAELEGREFHARADQITYDESQGLYLLRSLGNGAVSIWRQTKVGGNFSRTDAQSATFIPSRNILKLDRTRGLDAQP